MKFSTSLLRVLKNAAEINQGIVIKKGSVLRTCSPAKNILLEAKVEEDFPLDFGIYDLGNLIGVISLFKEIPEIEFEEKNLSILGKDSRSEITYRYTPTNLIISPPDKQITLPSEDIKFHLLEDDLNWVLKTARVLDNPNVVVESTGEKIYLSSMDMNNDSSNIQRLTIGDGNGDMYSMVFKTENLKLIPASYDVMITRKSISKFHSKELGLTYFISNEMNSVFKGGN